MQKEFTDIDEHHFFTCDDGNYIYFPKYFQLLSISEETSKFFLNCDEKERNRLLNHLTSNFKKAPIKIPTENPDINNLTHAVFLHVANTCNMKCIYCFEVSDNKKEKAIMDFDVSKKSLSRFIDEIPKESANSFVNFFGGEPLLAWDTVKESIKFARDYSEKKGKKLNLRIVTNGVLLTQERIDFLSEYNIGITISIDGNEKLHTKQRPLRSGSIYYKDLINNIKYLLKKIPAVEARSTYIDYDYPLYKVYEDLFEIGFPIVCVEPDLLNIDDLKLKKLFKQLEDLKKYIISNIHKMESFDYTIFKMRITNIYRPVYYKWRNCRAGGILFAVDTLGNIHSCHRFVSDNKPIGNIDNGFKMTDELFFDRSELTCKDCWNRYICSGGCFYNNSVRNGNALTQDKHFCIYSKKLSEICFSLLKYIPKKLIRKLMNV